MSTTQHRLSVEANINRLFDRMHSDDLPMFYSVDPDKVEAAGDIEVTWMVQDSVTDSRKLLAAFEGWSTSPGFDRHDQIVSARDGGIEVTAWVHPDSVELKVLVKP